MAEPNDAFSFVKELRETGFSASIVTTYNAYLPFYEEVVLRRLVASGCTNNIVLMDARQCAVALSQDSTRPCRAGVDYTLVPVWSPGAFHPKILLRLGKRKGSLFVGSHNLTVAGFGLNDELTNRFEYDAKARKGEIAAFTTVVELLRDFIAASPNEVGAAIDAAVEAVPWLGKLHSIDADVTLIGSRTGAPSLWEQVRARLPKRVRRALVVAPFFDQGFELVRRIHDDLGGPEVVVGMDPDTAEVNAAKRHDLVRVRFVDVRTRIPSPGKRKETTPYLHAKALVFEGDGETVLVTGSANASGAAFLASGRQRNTECVVVRRLEATSDVLDELGLGSLFDAPEVAGEAWEAISARLPDQAEGDADSESASAILAVVDDGRFRISDVDGASLAAIRALDAEGVELGRASVVAAGPPVILEADATVVDSASFLVLDDGMKQRWAIVHRPHSIAEHYASDTRRALRQALGSLDEDPAQLEVLLRLSEKVIFDDDASIDVGEPRLIHRAGQEQDREVDSASVDSLAVDSAGRRPSRKRKSIASGDITVLLDALIRRLGRGDAQPASTTSSTPNEEERIGADDDTDELPPEPPDLGRLGVACQRKTRTLLTRMKKQLEACREQGTPRRGIVQVAAVLGILRALRIIELRDEWRRSQQRLLSEDALHGFFWEACPLLMVGEGAVIPALLEQLDGQSCEELSMALGLMIWLGWECEVDIGLARAEGGRAGVDEDQWPWLQCLAYLASACATDDHALEIAAASIRATPRRKWDGDAWLHRHRAFLDDIAVVVSNPSACVRLQRSPRPGDIVYLASQFEPRVRLVMDVQQGGRGYSVKVLDEEADKGERTFLADRVGLLAPPVRLARDAG